MTSVCIYKKCCGRDIFYAALNECLPCLKYFVNNMNIPIDSRDYLERTPLMIYV